MRHTRGGRICVELQGRMAKGSARKMPRVSLGWQKKRERERADVRLIKLIDRDLVLRSVFKRIFVRV